MFSNFDLIKLKSSGQVCVVFKNKGVFPDRRGFRQKRMRSQVKRYDQVEALRGFWYCRNNKAINLDRDYDSRRLGMDARDPSSYGKTEWPIGLKVGRLHQGIRGVKQLKVLTK